MPRSSVVLSPSALGADEIESAARRVWELAGATAPLNLREIDDGAALQVRGGETVVLTVLRPRLLPTLDEVARLLPGVTDLPSATRFWSDAYTPWEPEGAIGVAILDAAVSASGARAVHHGLS